jgi:sugar/nucleoside kinase (ribokinase family)
VPYRIGVLGPLNIDLIIRGTAPTDIDELRRWTDVSDVFCLVGGAAGYVSQDLQKLGNRVRLVSCIGDDPFGGVILTTLARSGIDPGHIMLEEGTEGAIAIFILLFGANKRPFTCRLPTHHGWPPALDDADRDYLLDGDLFHSAGYLHFPDLWGTDILSVYQEAKARGLITSLDPQFPLTPLDPPWIRILRPLASYVDVLMVDESEALNIAGKDRVEDAADVLCWEGFGTVAIKRGDRGVLVRGRKEVVEVPAIPPREFLDSIGAGDAFDAAFLQGMLEGRPIGEAARMGVTAATMSIEGVGGTETFPKRQRLVPGI